jgi:hypothetical protein
MLFLPRCCSIRLPSSRLVAASQPPRRAAPFAASRRLAAPCRPGRSRGGGRRPLPPPRRAASPRHPAAALCRAAPSACHGRSLRAPRPQHASPHRHSRCTPRVALRSAPVPTAVPTAAAPVAASFVSPSPPPSLPRRPTDTVAPRAAPARHTSAASRPSGTHLHRALCRARFPHHTPLTLPPARPGCRGMGVSARRLAPGGCLRLPCSNLLLYNREVQLAASSRGCLAPHGTAVHRDEHAKARPARGQR